MADRGKCWIGIYLIQCCNERLMFIPPPPPTDPASTITCDIAIWWLLKHWFISLATILLCFPVTVVFLCNVVASGWILHHKAVAYADSERWRSWLVLYCVLFTVFLRQHHFSIPCLHSSGVSLPWRPWPPASYESLLSSNWLPARFQRNLAL